jgi:hypothetical protein
MADNKIYKTRLSDRDETARKGPLFYMLKEMIFG